MSIRFVEDDNQVSIAEFLEYLMTSKPVRLARAATAAVRMSVELLQIDDINVNGDEQNENEEPVSISILVFLLLSYLAHKKSKTKSFMILSGS